MSGPKHSAQTLTDGLHAPISYQYADAAARTGASGFTADDLNKFARQLDDNSVWMLTVVTPIWAAVGSGSSSNTPGPPGISGDDGADGESGPPGAQGSAGAAGTTGAQGPQGPAGSSGDDGEPGELGPPGAAGPQGTAGTTGAPGSQGPVGQTGEDGSDGELGPQGPQGTQGTAGTTGATGAQGIPGPSGDDGDEGQSGVPGATGAAGAIGAQGPAVFLEAEPGEDGQLGPPGLTPRPGAVLGFGAAGVSTTTTTRYLYPWHEDSTATTAPVQMNAPRAGTLQNFRVRHGTPAGNGNNVVYTVRVNGAASALVVTLASTTAAGSDLSHAVQVAAGDLIDIEVTKGTAIGTSPTDITSTLEFI